MKASSNCPRAIAIILLFSIFAILMTMSGCTGSRTKHYRSTSVIGFLYPGKNTPVADQRIPALSLPLRVGIAFVPAPGSDGRYPSLANVTGFSETQKQALMQRVAAEFKAYPFVQSIEIVPSSYLRAGGGFENLNQIKNMLGVDVIALVAYDQVQFTAENVFSLAYWTVVGAYIVEGNRNDTHTLMEAAVYDIASQRLLFRAPGASQVRAGATAIGVPTQLRVDAQKGFDEATSELIANLKAQLGEFKERAKAAPADIQITHKPGYTGAGGLETGIVVALGLLALTRLVTREKRISHDIGGTPESLAAASEFIYASQPGDMTKTATPPKTQSPP